MIKRWFVLLLCPIRMKPSPTRGSDISGLIGNGPTIDLLSTSMMPGDTLTCTVDVQNSSGMTARGIANVTIANRLPDVPMVTIDPTSPVPGVDDVTCTATGLNDQDGQSVRVSEYTWTSDTGSMAMGPVYQQAVSELQAWTCTVTVTDGIDSNVGASSVQATSTVIDTLTFTTCGQVGRQDPLRLSVIVHTLVPLEDGDGGHWCTAVGGSIFWGVYY